MGLKLDLVVHVYGSSDGKLSNSVFEDYSKKIEASVKRSFDWIEEHSEFEFKYTVQKFRTHKWGTSHNILPWSDFKWSEIKDDAPFIIAFYYELQPPNGGATWPISSQYGGWDCTCLSVPYGYTDGHWKPAEGYPQYMDAILVHETLHATDSWLEFFGYSIYEIKHIYHAGNPPGSYIDCGNYSSHAACYDAVLDQYKSTEYEKLANEWGIPYTGVARLEVTSPLQTGDYLGFIFHGSARM